MFVVLRDYQTYTVSEEFIKNGGKVFSGVLNGLNIKDSDKVSSWLFVFPGTTTNKQPPKMPKITLDNLRKKVKLW